MYIFLVNVRNDKKILCKIRRIFIWKIQQK